MGAILFISLAIFLILSVPIGIGLGLSTITAILITKKVPLMLVAQKMFVGTDSFPLMAIPFFMLAGDLMSEGGVSKRLVKFANSLLGSFTGGLAHVTTLTSMFFAAISGSSAATCASVGSVMIPEMEKRNYARNFTAAVVATSGVTGIVIPPSIPLVVYGVVAGASIGDLFMGGFGPGIFMGLSLMAVNYYYAKKNGYGGVNKIQFGEIAKSFAESFWGLLMPLIILGGIYGGIFTPTEAAAVAAFYSFLVGMFVYRELKLSAFYGIFTRAGISTAIVILIIAAANLFGYLLTAEQIPQKIAQAFLSMSDNPIIILLWINLVLFISGMFLNASGAIIILTPILLPLVTSVGIDPVFFGVLMVVNLSVGLVTPPVGLDLFVASSVAKVSFDRLVQAVIPFLLILILDVLIITYVPDIIMFLPNLLK